MKRSGIVVGFALLACLSACGTDEKSVTQGELILALQTDMELPKDVDKVRIRVASFGSTIFSNDYQVGPSELKIPATLGLLANPDRPSAPVTIQVIGFQQGRPRVMRETVTTIPVQRIATLRVPIEWLCDESARMQSGEVESTCPTEETCVSGMCMASAVDSDDLPDFRPSDIFGGGDGSGNGTCFDVAQCFANAVTLSVDASTCRATLPTDEPTLNVALKLPGTGDGICSGGVCLVPLDGGEGGQWSRVGAGAGSDQGASIQLPQGVCERLRSGKIEAVIAAKQCVTKTVRVPPCGAWSSSGGSGSISSDAGSGNLGDANPGSDASGSDAGPPMDDGGSSGDSVAMPDMGGAVDSSTGSDSRLADMGPIFDGGGRNDVCTLDDCGQPPSCQPPPAPTDGGMCMGVVSAPASNTGVPCQWDVPGRITTSGVGFCGNLLNVELMNFPGMPGLRRIPQVPEGRCEETVGWQFIPSMNVLELCPAACAPVKTDGVAVQFVYGCLSTGQVPDGGPGPIDGSVPPPPDGPGPHDAMPPPPPTDADAGMAPMVPIIGGMFQMGCVPQDMACNPDEVPNHTVEVSDFAIDETEVTQAAYDLCIRAGICVAPPCSSWQPTTKGNWPVACVNWLEASNYCSWLGKRLPTEAEWEIAAHGNSASIYPWGDQTPDCTRANFSLCSFNSTQAARMFVAGKSVFNAYDMAGNVGEWVFDWHGQYEGPPPVPNPTGPPTGTLRVVRGGDYSSGTAELRATHRVPMDPNTRVDDIGFRCAKPGF
jgi:formylglycine-generating enzyme required for sulfatase activity